MYLNFQLTKSVDNKKEEEMTTEEVVKNEEVVNTPESYKILLEQFKINQEALKKSQDMTNLALQNFN